MRFYITQYNFSTYRFYNLTLPFRERLRQCVPISPVACANRCVFTAYKPSYTTLSFPYVHHILYFELLFVYYIIFSHTKKHFSNTRHIQMLAFIFILMLAQPNLHYCGTMF